MKIPCVTEHLLQLVNSPDGNVELAEAALLIAKEEYPELNVPECLGEISRLTDNVCSRLPSGGAAMGDVVMTLNEYLFDIEGFSGDVDTFYDAQNSFLNKVLEQKRGNPITLSILYIVIGRIIGLPLYGITFPGHFLVKCAGDNRGIILDPFAGGVTLGDNELQAILKHVYGESSLPDIPLEGLLSIANTREIVVRMLRNLKHVYLQKGKPDKAIWTVDKILQLMPGSLSDVKERGQIYEQLQHFQAAAEDYRYYLERMSQTSDIEEVYRRLAQIEDVSLSHYWIH